MKKPVRLVSWNIHKGIGGRDRTYDISRILAVLEELQPDILCLQEVDTHVRRSSMHNQPEILSQKLGFDRLFQLNVPVGKSGGYGNLIMSRWGMEYSRHHSLRIGNRKPRGVQLARILTPIGPVAIGNWHLGLTHPEQVRQAIRFSSLIEGDLWSDLPMIVAGDTNDWGNRLFGKCLAAHGFEQATLPVIQLRSFPAWFPVASLDKIFTRHGVRCLHKFVLRNRLTRDASDHLPLIIDFDVHK
jgi:endonuclease/exonuclease/phosphatase family metal-dependent hydrolase